MTECHGSSLLITGKEPRAGAAAADIFRYRDDSIAKRGVSQIRPVHKLAVAITGVATAVALLAIVLRLALIGECPITERSTGLVVPKAALCRPTEVIAVEVAGEGFTCPQVHDARMGRVARMVHGIPV